MQRKIITLMICLIVVIIGGTTIFLVLDEEKNPKGDYGTNHNVQQDNTSDEDDQEQWANQVSLKGQRTYFICSLVSYTGEILRMQYRYVNEVDNDVEIWLMNGDDIQKYQIVVTNNQNQQRILTADTDSEMNDFSWTVKEGCIECKIHPDVFKQDGNYAIKAFTEYDSDKKKDYETIFQFPAVEVDELQFVVDNTPPQVTISGIQNENLYISDQEFSFEYSDASELAEIKVERTDGSKVIETLIYSFEEFKDSSSGSLNAIAKEYDGYQTITVSVTDRAGNVGSQSVRVFVGSIV